MEQTEQSTYQAFMDLVLSRSDHRIIGCKMYMAENRFLIPFVMPTIYNSNRMEILSSLFFGSFFSLGFCRSFQQPPQVFNGPGEEPAKWLVEESSIIQGLVHHYDNFSSI